MNDIEAVRLMCTEQEIAAKDAEIARLKDAHHNEQNGRVGDLIMNASLKGRIALFERALKPVMECDIDFDICEAYEDGSCLEEVSRPYDAVREAQRIILDARKDKNYFWKGEEK